MKHELHGLISQRPFYARAIIDRLREERSYATRWAGEEYRPRHDSTPWHLVEGRRFLASEIVYRVRRENYDSMRDVKKLPKYNIGEEP